MTGAAAAVPRPSGFGRAVAAAAAAVVAACGLTAPAHAATTAVPPSQALVVLMNDHAARAGPNAAAHRIETVRARRPLTRVRTVLPVLATAQIAGVLWLRVRLPGRPNAHVGWITSPGTRPAVTLWSLAVSLAHRRVRVYHQGHQVRSFRVVVGKPSTPTPRGRFFVEEAVSLSRRAAGAPFALATSARSQVLQEFDGGPGQIALHGTGNLPGRLGSAASHGCIRMSPRAITWLAGRIRSGTPVTISR